MRRLAAALALLFAAGCSSGPAGPTMTAPPLAPAAPLALSSAAPPPPPVPPSAPISVPPAPNDPCGAVALAHLVGRPRTEIPVPIEPSKRRVVCETCPRTEDVRPDRLTIEYDQASGRVTRLTCG